MGKNKDLVVKRLGSEKQICEKYDGFYAVCTNLDDSIGSIVKANKRRWEIEKCFRIMKTVFEALHEAFDFCTSKQIVPIAKMRNICSQTKK